VSVGNPRKSLYMRPQDFKYFDQDLMFCSLIKDLKDLETSGITIPDGKTFKGTVCAFAGDNLRSHFIGGFTEFQQELILL